MKVLSKKVRRITLILVLLAATTVLVGVVYAAIAPGPWSPMNYGLDNDVYVLAAAPDGTVYAGGDFDDFCGDSDCNLVNQIAGANKVAQWDGSTWSPMGFGFDNNVNALVFAPDGTLYAGGDFDDFCGDSDCNLVNQIAGANSIVKWDGSNWSSVGYGLYFDVDALAFGPDGTLYAGGGISRNTVQLSRTMASWNVLDGCGQWRCGSRFKLNFDILRLTTRGLERWSRSGKR